MFAITEEKIDAVVVVNLEGRLDSIGAPEIESHCKNLIKEGNESLLIDMAEINYISSAGLRSLLLIAKAIKACSGTVVFCNLVPMVREVLKISGFEKILTIVADRTEAMEKF